MPESGREIRLVLFLTRGMSLRKWDEAGMLSREVALYQRLQQRGVRVTLMTYGDESDREYGGRLPGIEICCREGGQESDDPGADRWVGEERLGEADLIKTNQMDGAEAALQVAKKWRKPLIARCGYMWSDFTARRHGGESMEAQRCRSIEERVFSAAERVVVTTEAMKADVMQRCRVLEDRVRVLPNYVDIDQFSPGDRGKKRPRRICYVGRLEQEQKNVRSLMAAVRGLDAELDIIGSGPLRGELEREAAGNPNVRVLGSVSNESLPGYLRCCGAFVLPSFYEGHPKAMIEAMACGLPVIAADVPGIREVISHGRTGWLCGTDVESLRAGIQRVLNESDLAEHLGRNAREFVVAHYALDSIVERELALYREVVDGAGRKLVMKGCGEEKAAVGWQAGRESPICE